MKRGTKIVLAIIAVLVLLPIIVVIVMSCIPDEPPPNDADLRITWVDIPDEENAVYHFGLAAEKLWCPEENEELIWDMLEDEAKWDTAFVEELIDNNRATFADLERGLACFQSQLPERTWSDLVLPKLSRWRQVARLASLRASFLQRSGKEKEAFDEAMKIVKLGHMIIGSKGGLIHYLTGVTCKGIGLKKLRAMLPQTSLDPASLTHYVRELQAYRASDQALADALRAEYMAAANGIDDVAAGKYGLKGSMGGPGPPGKKIKVGYFTFRPNQTKRVFAEVAGASIENIQKYPAQWEPIRHPVITDLESNSLGARFRRRARGNAVGQILCAMLLPDGTRLTQEKCVVDVHVSATQVFIALKCYKNETGKLPDSLEELLPEYFDKVPEDAFDGRPLRYSREKKIIYSIGTDLKDSGGDLGEEWNSEEPTFKIEF